MTNELSTIANSLNLWEDETKLKEIKAIFAPKLNNNEFSAFIGMGKANDLNPFLREIWSIKYADNAPAQIFIGRDGYRKSAQRNPDYQTHVVESVHEKDDFKFRNGEVHHEYGAVRGKLIGAYCMVYKKSCERPTYVYCLLSEYSTGKSLWHTETGKQATMIKKVAEAQALRMAFQEQYQGTYSEFERHEVIDAEWSPKQTQSDKMNTLLAKKGLNHAKTNNDNGSNASVDTYDTGLCSANSNDSPHANETEVCPGLAADGESKVVTNPTQNVAAKCSEEQLDVISCSIHEKGFDEARKLKALKHFGVSSFAELSEEQADEMIKIIAKVG